MSNQSETILNGRYRLVSQQGSGGMAVIYKAIDQALGRTVAVKILRPSLTNDPAFLARFRNEARSVANLAHPNIVTVHDVGADGPTHYIVMEFIEGQDLKRIIRSEGALPLDRALSLVVQICAGIGFAHRSALVHADVKPQNILITKEDTVKVTDFGIAQALSDADQNEKQSVVWGSPHYFAPEQARGDKPTPASDVYSIGILLFEMLTGRLPFTGQNQQELALAHIRDRVPMVTEYNPTVPEALAQIVYKTMSKEPSGRYRMADQLGRVLSGFQGKIGQQGVSSRGSTPPPRPSTLPSAEQPSGVPDSVAPWEQQVPPMPPSSPPSAQPPLPPQYRQGNESAVTEKVGLEPYAAPPGQPSIARPAPPMSATPPPQTPSSPFPPTNTDSRAFPPTDPYAMPGQQSSEGMDIVTIALAILAFLAVACLIPLYIAVFQARFGG